MNCFGIPEERKPPVGWLIKVIPVLIPCSAPASLLMLTPCLSTPVDPCHVSPRDASLIKRGILIRPLEGNPPIG